jgi:hypothetical protein
MCRHPILRAAQLTTVVNFLISSFQQNALATIVEARKFVRDQFDIDIIPNILHHILSWDGRIKTLPSSPIEDTRIAVTMYQIQVHF